MSDLHTQASSASGSSSSAELQPPRAGRHHLTSPACDELPSLAKSSPRRPNHAQRCLQSFFALLVPRRVLARGHAHPDVEAVDPGSLVEAKKCWLKVENTFRLSLWQNQLIPIMQLPCASVLPR